MNVIELGKMQEKLDLAIKTNGFVRMLYKTEKEEKNAFCGVTKKIVWEETKIVKREDNLVFNKDEISWSLISDCDNNQIYIPNIFGNNPLK